MTITLRALISYITIDRALKYTIVNTFGDDFPCSQKINNILLHGQEM
jgi:hypothetical protein